MVKITLDTKGTDGVLIFYNIKIYSSCNRGI